jgi:hypothetical protein
VIGADLGPNSVVSFTIRQGEVAARLGRITAAPNGHFRVTRGLPSTFPNGYAQLIASGSDGSKATVWVLVGERKESAPASSRTGWSTGRSLIALGVVLGGLAALAATTIWLVRRHRPHDRSAAS